MYNIVFFMGIFSFLVNEINHNYLDNQINISVNNFISEYETYQEENTFNGESADEISAKLNKHLKGVLKNKGEFIVEYSLSIGLDPYLAAAVMLHETGCTWNCSYLSRACNNVAGNKGSPSCNGGSYKKFDSLEDGMKFAMRKLNNYYKKGKTTPKQINPYYATDKTWYKKVDNYIKKLKK